MSSKKILEELNRMIEQQEKRVADLGRSIIPNLTSEDLLQPMDFQELENHPPFRYQEGVLQGMHSAKSAINYLLKNPHE